MKRVRELSLAWGLLACLAPLACRPVETRSALGFACPQQEASVFVDGRYVGTIRTLSGRYVLLKPGVYRVELRLVGYFPRYRILRLAPGQTGILKIRLVPRLKWTPSRSRSARRRPGP